MLLLLMLLLSMSTAEAQIMIGGIVYGGGNEGNTDGSTKVTVRAGDINAVFGGARKADVKGNAFVNIDGEHASNYIVINKVYGGNDISGEIGDPQKQTNNAKKLPTELTLAGENSVTKDWDAFVRVSTKTDTEGKETADAQRIYIGQLFGGGNGDYDYTSDGSPYKGLSSPVMGKTYLEIVGGSIVYAYGGGNNATVTKNTVICVDNPSKVVNSIKDANNPNADTSDPNSTNYGELLTTGRFKNKMGINTGFSYPSSDAFQIGRFFGGNNKAEMSIRPTWNLKSGKIRNLYSGGNQGDMTSPEGLLLNIDADSKIIVDNLFGGCRMADVKPMENGVLTTTENLAGYNFPRGFSARVVISGGDINNVYGGNDVSGKVYGGNAVGIRISVRGDVYGGGNGSYPYTDNWDLRNDDIYGDLYYGERTNEKFSFADQNASVEALNAFRPNAEQVSIRVVGTETKPTIVHGSIYCGGNSATIMSTGDNRTVELKIGSYVIADNVFLGNNGANMVTEDILKHYAYNVDADGKVVTSGGTDFSTLVLTDKTTFQSYMDGVAMTLKPSVVFDSKANGDADDYKEYSSYFGSFFCGGNVGSMKANGKITINFNKPVYIYNKVVGGCNDANIYAQTGLNAEYLGGLLGNPDPVPTGSPEGTIGDKLELNLSGLKIQPKRWKYQRDASNYNNILKDADDNPLYDLDANGNAQLEWNTVIYDAETQSFKDVAPVTEPKAFDKATDLDRRLLGGNIYGGCYNRGHINGNVIINLNASIHERDKLFDVVSNEGDILYVNVENAEEKENYYTITKRNTGVILSHQGMDVLGGALNVFGGGYGGDSEIWGSTTINLNKGYTFQIFGGGEAGAIGKPVNNPTTEVLEYAYDQNYSTYINLNGDANLPGVARGATGDSPDMAECEFIYGGAFEGKIAGDTHINLGNGRIFNSFAGSCNADILGHTETYIGRSGVDADGKDIAGFPWVRDHLYGGNDLGGEIKGAAKFSSRIRDEVKSMVEGDYSVTSYMEYTQGRVRNILGGCFGNYNYTDEAYANRTEKKPYMHNAFVNFRPSTNANNSVEKVFGAGEGYSGDRDGDKCQDHSYVLIDIPENVENFANTEVFGAGAYNGLGMRYTAAETFGDGFDLNEASAVIDLMRGQIGAAYGGSFEQGITRRTVVNVPEGSTIKIGSIFGGAYGSETYEPCDVYEANVNYRTHSDQAYLIYNPRREDEKTKQMIGNELQKGAIYGGNNQERRTLYGRINIYAPVKQKHYKYEWSNATVYGAGYGQMTWNEYTEVNLYDGAKVWEVYGGGEAGGVMSAESVQKYIALNPYNVSPADKWIKAWTLGSGYDDGTFANEANSYASNTYTNLNNPLARTAEMDDRTTKTYRYNTNVIIHKGAYVGNYAYGGGLGKEGEIFYGSGDVYGTTYIALLGGIVNKDIYAAGTVGAVYNLFGAENYTASTNAYIAGGMLRNVYGGGWKGDVGRHTGTSSDPNSLEGDILSEAHVVIGIRPDQKDSNLKTELKKVLGNEFNENSSNWKDAYGFYAGEPAIQRNAYGGGEGGAIFGSSYLTINNGYIGYVHLNANETLDEYGAIADATVTTPPRYVEKIHDDTYWDGKVWKGANRLVDCGNVFGGGYDVRSSVDETHVTLWNGNIRNSMHGGGEIATIGRGAVTPSGQSNSVRTLAGFYKAGKTNVEMFNGHVLRNVFGGGKGYNIYGYGQEGTLYTDGYVFGQTEVHIHGGEIGTDEGVANGYGNVFGGGDIGYVYSPSSPRYYLATTPATRERTGSPGHFYYYINDNKDMEEDCKVVISPWLQVRDANDNGVEINGKTKYQYEYFETEDLNTLVKGAEEWGKLFTGDYVDGVANVDDPVERGVKIHNAVFAGGNVSSNSDQTYANATTVYGNTTATINDIFHRDFITVGTEHTGGLYGGGNLSVVDGYRELNITNYGTDYYGLKQTIKIDEYRKLSNRERAYFQLEYECKAKNVVEGETQTGIKLGDEFYYTGQKLKEEEYLKLLNSTDPTVVAAAKDINNFEPYGFCSIYAGRLLNTIQRADLCGVFGSRMVLQGAKDRVAEVGEDVDYTINRVGELSLNQQRSGGTTHGNYFGIYSVVNYLGNLTSDVHFNDEMLDGDGNVVYFNEDNNMVKTIEIDNEDVDVSTLTPAQMTQYRIKKNTYYGYKSAKHTSSDRNKGESFNQVALASGVFLELTTEESTADEKKHGYVTGVIELDLINVRKDQVGGGFVYAKNEHRVPRYYPSKPHVMLSPYNQMEDNEAITYKRYLYSKSDPDYEPSDWPESGAKGNAYTLGYPNTDSEDHDFGVTKEWQTSGNFIHHEKRIIDDCYPTNNAYIITSENYSEAHYWYVKGDVYIYDQKVSAYTGSANAYSKFVNLPLTITAASHGQLQLLNVKPNLYAYYTVDKDGNKVKFGTMENGKPIDKVTVNNESDTYHLNDVVSWWDWHQMSPTDRQYFVPETYVNCLPCKVNGEPYEAGAYVMLPDDSVAFKTNYIDQGLVIDTKGDQVTKFYELFRSSNNISHETGYVLTFDMNSPKKWDDYYSRKIGTSIYNTTTRITKAEYEALLAAETTEQGKQGVIDTWREGPTFTPKAGKGDVYGKRNYTAGDIITKTAYNNAPAGAEGQDKMKPAYVATKTVTYSYGGTQKTMNPGAAISETEYNEAIKNTSAASSFDLALICTNTVKLSKDEYMLYGELKTAAEITAIKAAIDADETRSTADKEKVKKEIDAAMEEAYILTASGTYGGQRFDEGTNYGAIEAWCSLPSADRDNFNYNYDALDLLVNSDYLKVNTDVTSMPDHNSTVTTYKEPYTDTVPVEYQAVYEDDTARDIYYNDNSHKSFAKGATGATIDRAEYETIRNDKKHYTYIKANAGETVYIATANFPYLGVPYGIGQLVDAEVYSHNTGSVTPKTFENDVDGYYCFDGYTKQDGTTTVSVGDILSATDYKNEAIVPNYQQYFIIQGKEPTETTTLYVSRESNAYDVMKEKIITVVYQYTYNEDDDDGSVKTTNELHVINIHLELESGAPVIGLLKDPPTVLPGNAVGLSRPDVNPGLYEVISNGWELYTTIDDANNHRNGVPFENNSTPVYWYQNQKNWVAFYSRTWLGKTYSNSVPLSVANYHDLDKVMKDPNHLYVDKSNVDRPCKIYLDNRECESDPNKNELDLLKDFFDLSLDPDKLDSHVRAGRNLEFFLNSDIDHSTKPNPDYDPEETENPQPARIPAPWTPIGNNNTTGDTGECFEGTFHGDGYTISGLDNSLFAHLCGEVYNLGVTGTFTGAGIAEEGSGYVENCWIKTTGTPTKVANENHFAVFGNPNRGSDPRGPVQVENCYYPESNDYQTPPSGDTYEHGRPTQMPDQSFYNGEVAYNLNGFYLHKRHYHGTSLGAGENNTDYLYLQPNDDGSLPDDMATGYYPNTYALYQPILNAVSNPIEKAPNYMGYVESRFYDGDFRYADGTVPETTDIHMRTKTVGEGDNAVPTTYYVPIWPDDYIYFGQTLNYGYVDGSVHQDLPSQINKNNGRLQTDAGGNRVYRAPAYYGSSEMQTAYFNPNAVFARSKKDDETMVAYKGMTAIDFSGYNDASYQEGLQGGKFYPPLLDDNGLTSFTNVDLTQNLLAYAPDESVNKATHDVLDGYFGDLAYGELDDDNGTDANEANYHRVAPVTVYDEQSVRGHVVFQTGTTYSADRDHFLVDKQDFNAPIGYTFIAGAGESTAHRMWYQRMPDNYVGKMKEDKSGFIEKGAGWEGISLPFKAEIVTTDTKGEITHFYNDDYNLKGHEYWLREFNGGSLKEGSTDIFVATFSKPEKSTDDGSKSYTNTFLWDYYYSHNERNDVNDDKYPDASYKYYSEARFYTDYPRLANGTPYIIGFPGERYYEFDLSGNFEAKTAQATIPEKLDAQTITFASVTGATIGVSDTELESHKKTEGDYTFVPNYASETLGSKAYILNADDDDKDNRGSSYNKTTATAPATTLTAVPFRPYFMLTSEVPASAARKTTRGVGESVRSIIFSDEQTQLQGQDKPDPRDKEYGSLSIYAKRKKIVVESKLHDTTEVRIVNPAGITVATFDIEPGETVETRINNSGVYIVQTSDAHYTKKLVVK